MTPHDERHAVVIGAGLAGAAVTAALARRGWQVVLFDRAGGPAQGASALPVGMLSPHVTRAPTPLSRLSALGVAHTRAELQRLVRPGAGWQPTEVDNHGHDAGRHPAALVRPGALVQAWLDEAVALQRLQTRWHTAVAGIERDQGRWRLVDAAGQPLASAPHVVVTAALGSLDLLTPPHSRSAALPLRPVQGQLSLGPLAGDALAPRPQRDDGVFVPDYHDEGLPPHWPARIWTLGATYERGATHQDVQHEAHQRNLANLRPWLPAVAAALEPSLREGRWLGWAGVRCASLDRLPLAGTLPDLDAWAALRGPGRRRPPLAAMPRLPGLHVLTALGSRGLSLAAWCAERLAARLHGEPADAPADLCDAIDPARFAWRALRRSGA